MADWGGFVCWGCRVSVNVDYVIGIWSNCGLWIVDCHSKKLMHDKSKIEKRVRKPRKREELEERLRKIMGEKDKSMHMKLFIKSS